MKKILLSLFTLAVVGLTAKVNAQCTIAQSSIIVNIKSVTANVGGGCTTIFDLTYDISNNGGNKWSYLHFWDAGFYPTVSYANGPGPKKTELNGGAGFPKPLLTTVAINYVSGTPVISLTYGADIPNIFPQTTGGITVTRTTVGSNQRFFITNISVASSNCAPLNLKADVWSAQDNNGGNVGCGVTGLDIRADEPLLRGLIFCVSPRTYSLSIQTKTTRNVTWNVYQDNAPFGVFSGTDVVVDGPRTESNTGDPAGIIYHTHGSYPLPGGAGSLYNIWIVATASGLTNSNSIFVTNTCAPLPVSFKSFTATRTRSNVAVKWETASEQNNSGFAVERNINGTWEQVAFIPSQAVNGTSASDLSYQFIDLNNTKGITQYRIKQIDVDAKTKYSEVRSVRGDGQIGKTIVYPNPSSDGKVNIVFEDAAVSRDISVSDMSGRTVKQLKGVTANNITIENLTPGVYSLRIVVPSTGDQLIEKIVVNNR